MGTELLARGVALGRGFAQINLERPDLIAAIHREYRDAGAGALKTNTFTSNRMRLKRFSLESKTREINLAGVKLAREAAGDRAFVLGSIGPLVGLPPAKSLDVFREQAEALAEGGCDALLLETFTDVVELQIGLRAARVTGLPVICQMVPLGELDVKAAARELRNAGADVVGVNCVEAGAAFMALKQMAVANLSAWPSAGVPPASVTPEDFADGAETLVGLGAHLVGGCCGIGPAHIRAVGGRIKGRAR